MEYHIEIKLPTECSQSELDSFKELLLDGNQIIREGIGGRIISNAYRLGFCYYRYQLVGIAAIKNPITDYKIDIFSKANYANEGIIFELGWVCTKLNFRERGICSNLVGKLINEFNCPLFATTRSSNSIMKHILEKNDFNVVGNSFVGIKEELQLYIRS